VGAEELVLLRCLADRDGDDAGGACTRHTRHISPESAELRLLFVEFLVFGLRHGVHGLRGAGIDFAVGVGLGSLIGVGNKLRIGVSHSLVLCYYGVICAFSNYRSDVIAFPFHKWPSSAKAKSSAPSGADGHGIVFPPSR
jgi:hypothetical protein